jgi:hypothetical protein
MFRKNNLSLVHLRVYQLHIGHIPHSAETNYLEISQLSSVRSFTDKRTDLVKLVIE